MQAWRSTFIAHLPDALREAAEALPWPRLERLLQRARAAWPDLGGDEEEFLAYVAERVAEDADLHIALDELHVDDLYLAFLCARGHHAAIRAFRDCHQAYLLSVATHSGPAANAEDVVQQVVAKLLLGDPPRPPAITRYAGRGSLRGWLKVTATREARSALRGAPARERADDSIDRLVDGTIDTSTDPEIEGIKRRCRAQFKLAFQRAFERLDPHERNILRHEHLDGLDGAQIAAIYGVHKATVSRWRAQARQTLLTHTRAIIEQELDLSRGEFDSMMRLIRSQLDVSLPKLLSDD